MKLCAALILSACLSASQAGALSCMRPNLAETFNRLQASDDIYNIAVGTLRITGKIPPYVEGRPRSVSAEFSGRFMGLNGLGKPQTRALTLKTHCVAHWCGGIPNDAGTEQLLFLRQSDNGPVLDFGACPEGNVSSVTQSRLDLLQSCLKRGECSASDLQKMEQF